MTLAINILHKAYSVLVADRRGVICDEDGSDCLDDSGNVLIDNYGKIFRHINDKLAIAVVGEMGCHPYSYDIEILDNATINNALKLISRFVKNPYGSMALYDAANLSLVTYFDVDTNSFQCRKLIYGLERSEELILGRSNVQFVFGGCGANAIDSELEKNINNVFTEEFQFDPEPIYMLLKMLYSKVSEITHYVSDDFDMYYATSDEPYFVRFEAM